MIAGPVSMLSAACLVGAVACVQAEAAGPTTASIDYCADQYVLALADRGQILGVSPRATKSFSFHRARAVGLPVMVATTEAILDTAPEVLIRFWGGDRRMADLLRRVGIATVNVTYGIDHRTIAGNLAAVGEILGRPNRAAALIATREARLTALEALPPLGLRALYLTPSGTTGGDGTDVDAMLSLAGLDNHAAAFGYVGWRTVSIERLISSPPDLFIGSFFEDSAVARSPWSVARHGRLAKLLDRIPTIAVPGRFLSCGGLFSVDAAAFIRSTVADLDLPAIR